ncbi:recombinase family protein [Streptomyces sp. NBC_01235]|uniref:recombinase family protein n=1 Tax=Streptomyces sp. NBC_01235 TaxID=2903788 RepID=UPI003FA34C0E
MQDQFQTTTSAKKGQHPLTRHRHAHAASSPRSTATAGPSRTWSTWSANSAAARSASALCSLHERLDTTTPGGRLVFHVFAALAEFIREPIVSGTREGLDAARARGRVGGRPTVATPEIIRAARDLLPNPENSITSIAKLLGVSPGTLYNHIPDLQELRASGRVPNQLSAD